MLGLVKHTPWKQKEVGLLAHATASANVAASTSAGKGAVVKLWVFTRVVTSTVVRQTRRQCLEKQSESRATSACAVFCGAGTVMAL
jgi:hypothetical protein